MLDRERERVEKELEREELEMEEFLMIERECLVSERKEVSSRCKIGVYLNIIGGLVLKEMFGLGCMYR